MHWYAALLSNGSCIQALCLHGWDDGGCIPLNVGPHWLFGLQSWKHSVFMKTFQLAYIGKFNVGANISTNEQKGLRLGLCTFKIH